MFLKFLQRTLTLEDCSIDLERTTLLEALWRGRMKHFTVEAHPRKNAAVMLSFFCQKVGAPIATIKDSRTRNIRGQMLYTQNG
ncbi:MAG: hypothetical protein ACOVSW_06725 [Candidatus Kapaibacteriota bacterium]